MSTEESAVATEEATVIKRGRKASVLPKAAARYEKAKKELSKLQAKKAAQVSLDEAIEAAEQEFNSARDDFQAAVSAVEGGE